jgi:hypothetical protein
MGMSEKEHGKPPMIAKANDLARNVVYYMLTTVRIHSRFKSCHVIVNFENALLLNYPAPVSSINLIVKSFPNAFIFC